MNRLRRGGATSEAKGAASAAIVFAILVAVVAVVAGAALLFGSAPAELAEPSTSPAGSMSSPDFRLTDEEAIKRFRELDDRRVRALEARDVVAIRTVFTADSPALKRAAKSIRSLLQDNVVVEEGWVLEEVSVESHSPQELMIRGIGVSAPVFRSEAGQEVAQETSPQRRHFECEMRVEDGSWLLDDCRVLRVEPLDP